MGGASSGVINYNTTVETPTQVNNISDIRVIWLIDGSIRRITPAALSEATSIDKYTFYNCTSLTSITIPEGVTKIGSSAFSDCTSLTSSVIPEGVTSIGDYDYTSVFASSPNLKSIRFEGTVEQWNMISLADAWNYHASITKVICSDGEVALN